MARSDVLLTEPEDTSEPSATKQAYHAIRQLILIGDLAPGEKLKIDTLRKRLDLGASPVREALSLLTSDQLVERLDQRGFRTAPVSGENFREILKLRCKLEAMALNESLLHATETWEENLILAHHRMDKEPRDNVHAFEERHRAFHMALLANCPSPILMKFCGQLYDLNIRYRFLAGRSSNYAARNVTGEHRAILDAALARDVTQARTHLLDHYQKTGAFLVHHFDET